LFNQGHRSGITIAEISLRVGIDLFFARHELWLRDALHQELKT
jgi:hypothetical protein